MRIGGSIQMKGLLIPTMLPPFTETRSLTLRFVKLVIFVFSFYLLCVNITCGSVAVNSANAGVGKVIIGLCTT